MIFEACIHWNEITVLNEAFTNDWEQLARESKKQSTLDAEVARARNKLHIDIESV